MVKTYSTSDLSKHAEPELSIFLPNCTLGAPSTAQARSHKFHIELGKSKGLSFGKEGAYSFRARSHDELMEWWNDVKQLSKVYRTFSIYACSTGLLGRLKLNAQLLLRKLWIVPVPFPPPLEPRGYLSEDEEEEEGGSSIEEEEEEEEEKEEEEEVR